jgi:hypothetical protein
MSTILEMAEAIRSEGMNQTKDAKPSARSIDVDARKSSKDLYERIAARSWRRASTHAEPPAIEHC